MISTYRDMFAVCATALLCLMAVGHSAPLDCKDTVRPLDQLDSHKFEGRWAMVAGSLNITEAAEPLRQSDSISIDFYNTTIIKSHRFGHSCQFFLHNVSIDGPNFNLTFGQLFTFTGTLFHTSCSDCVVLSLVADSPNYKSVEFYLFSKRREVDQKEMEEFITQVECLKMPQHFVMDPSKELCPERPRSSSA